MKNLRKKVPSLESLTYIDPSRPPGPVIPGVNPIPAPNIPLRPQQEELSEAPEQPEQDGETSPENGGETTCRNDQGCRKVVYKCVSFEANRIENVSPEGSECTLDPDMSQEDIINTLKKSDITMRLLHYAVESRLNSYYSGGNCPSGCICVASREVTEDDFGELFRKPVRWEHELVFPHENCTFQISGFAILKKTNPIEGTCEPAFFPPPEKSK